jgi:hypothetical protein
MGSGGGLEGSGEGATVVGPQAVAYLYPWDLVGDPLMVARLVSAGFEHVSVAAAYHSVRASTPQHPLHRFVVAERAALYRPVRSAVWAGRSLRPFSAPWTGREDSFKHAVEALDAGGLRVSAWVVLTHNTTLGREHRDLAVSNCFGDSYDWALCPANAEVREYAALLATEAVRDLALEGVSLEACGQLGVEHGSHHEKTAWAYSPLGEEILSICCCGACQRSWEAEGMDARATVQALKEAFETAERQHDGAVGAPEEVLGAATAASLLTCRQHHCDALLEEVLGSLLSADDSLRITLHAQASPWATGASPGLTPSSAQRPNAVLVPIQATSTNIAGDVAAARHLVPPEVSVAAYVNLLAPIAPDDFDEHASRLLKAGADELHLYHFGLANPERLPLFSRLTSTWR